jgi:hypothetical protein
MEVACNCAVVLGTALPAGWPGFDSRWCHWHFSLTQSFRPHYGICVDSVSNRNMYQKYFLGVKGAGV